MQSKPISAEVLLQHRKKLVENTLIANLPRLQLDNNIDYQQKIIEPQCDAACVN